MSHDAAYRDSSPNVTACEYYGRCGRDGLALLSKDDGASSRKVNRRWDNQNASVHPRWENPSLVDGRKVPSVGAGCGGVPASAVRQDKSGAEREDRSSFGASMGTGFKASEAVIATGAWHP